MTAGTAKAALPLLLVEDERSVMDFIRTALERNGYACHPANSAAEGIRALEAGHFSGIISDMRTPGGVDGADVHAVARSIRRGTLGSSGCRLRLICTCTMCRPSAGFIM